MYGAMRRYINQNPSNFDPRQPLKAAVQAAKELCLNRFEAFGCAGQASKIKAVSLEAMANRYKKGELDAIIK